MIGQRTRSREPSAALASAASSTTLEKITVSDLAASCEQANYFTRFATSSSVANSATCRVNLISSSDVIRPV